LESELARKEEALKGRNSVQALYEQVSDLLVRSISILEQSIRSKRAEPYSTLHQSLNDVEMSDFSKTSPRCGADVSSQRNGDVVANLKLLYEERLESLRQELQQERKKNDHIMKVIYKTDRDCEENNVLQMTQSFLGGQSMLGGTQNLLLT